MTHIHLFLFGSMNLCILLYRDIYENFQYFRKCHYCIEFSKKHLEYEILNISFKFKDKNDILTFSLCSIFTADHFHITYFSGPSWSTLTSILILFLPTSCVIFTRACATPVYIFFTVISSISIWAATGVIRSVVLTCSSI